MHTQIRFLPSLLAFGLAAGCLGCAASKPAAPAAAAGDAAAPIASVAKIECMAAGDSLAALLKVVRIARASGEAGQMRDALARTEERILGIQAGKAECKKKMDGCMKKMDGMDPAGAPEPGPAAPPVDHSQHH